MAVSNWAASSGRPARTQHAMMALYVTVLGRTAVANTELVAAYMAIDPRVCELCLVVKHWARQRRCAAPAIALRARATLDAPRGACAR